MWVTFRISKGVMEPVSGDPFPGVASEEQPDNGTEHEASGRREIYRAMSQAPVQVYRLSVYHKLADDD